MDSVTLGIWLSFSETLLFEKEVIWAWEQALACHTFKFSFCRQLISLTSDVIPNIVVTQKGRKTKRLKRARSDGMWPPRPLFVCFKAACLQGCEESRWYSLFRVSSPACVVPLAGRIVFLRAVAGDRGKTEHRFLRSHAAQPPHLPVAGYKLPFWFYFLSCAWSCFYLFNLINHHR